MAFCRHCCCLHAAGPGLALAASLLASRPPVELFGDPSADPGASLRVHFLTFGQGQRFEAAVADLCDEARHSGRFAALHCLTELPEEVLADGRWRGHLAEPRGLGFWFWKGALAQWLLKDMREGEVLLYADAGCSIRDVPTWGALFAFLSDVDVLAFRHGYPGPRHPEFQYTKGDVFARFVVEGGSLYGRSGQVRATYWAIKNSARAREFVDKWVDLMADLQLLGDAPSTTTDHEGFVDHRHDQSLFSMLVKANQPRWPGPPHHGLRFGLDGVGAYEALPRFDEDQPRHPHFGIPGLRVQVLAELSPAPRPEEGLLRWLLMMWRTPILVLRRGRTVENSALKVGGEARLTTSG